MESQEDQSTKVTVQAAHTTGEQLGQKCKGLFLEEGPKGFWEGVDLDERKDKMWGRKFYKTHSLSLWGNAPNTDRNFQ